MSSNYFNNHLNFSKYVSLPYKRKSLIYTSINEIFWFDDSGTLRFDAPTIEYSGDVFCAWASSANSNEMRIGRFDGVDDFPVEANFTDDEYNPYYLVEHNNKIMMGRFNYAFGNSRVIDPSTNPVTTQPGGTDMEWQISGLSLDGYIYSSGTYTSNRPVIRRSTTGLAGSWSDYWYAQDHINPADPEYTHWITSVDSDGVDIYWMNSFGQIWSSTNGGTSPIYDKIDVGDTVEWSRSQIFIDGTRMYASGDYDIVYSDDYSTPTPTFNNINNYPLDLLYLVRIFKLNNRYFICGINTSNDGKVWYTDNMLTGTWYDFYTRPASDYIERMIYSPTYDMYFISAHLGIAGVRAS